MRRALPAVLLLLILPVSSVAQDWTAIPAKVSAGVFRLEAQDREGRKGICAAVFINDQKDVVLTAAHCIPPLLEGRSITVDDRHAIVERANDLLDLAILRVPGLNGSPIALRAEPITIGTPIAFVGFAFGAARQKYTFGFISDVEDGSLAAGSSFFNATAISGQSGGLIVDAQGALVSIVQSAYVAQVGSISAGPTPKRLKDFGEGFWPQP